MLPGLPFLIICKKRNDPLTLLQIINLISGKCGYYKFMSIETPEYQSLQKEKNIEIRAYSPYITAEVLINGADYNDAATRGFSPLARFIFGANTSSRKISMTAPVTAQPLAEKIAMTSPVTVAPESSNSDGAYRVAFSMPRQYTMETLPVPVDPRVKFFQHPAQKMAVIRFSGFFNQKNFDNHLNQLRNWLRSKNIREVGLPVVAGYDPPFTPWFLKHNEIMIEIEPNQEKSPGIEN